jgi:hypothetical protein
MSNIMDFNKKSAPDPSKVEELCADQRWSSAGFKMASLPGNKFGTLVEQFEKAAKGYDEGSEDYKIYMEARQKASDIYREQILSDIRKDTSNMNRAELETCNHRLFQRAGDFEDDDSYIRSRLLWATHMAGDWWQKNNGDVHSRRASGPGYQQFGPKKPK